MIDDLMKLADKIDVRRMRIEDSLRKLHLEADAAEFVVKFYADRGAQEDASDAQTLLDVANFGIEELENAADLLLEIDAALRRLVKKEARA